MLSKRLAELDAVTHRLVLARSSRAAFSTHGSPARRLSAHAAEALSRLSGRSSPSTHRYGSTLRPWSATRRSFRLICNLRKRLHVRRLRARHWLAAKLPNRPGLIDRKTCG